MKTQETRELPASVLVKSQKKTFGPVVYSEHGRTYKITAEVRYDDQCGNGHNSFSITAEIYCRGALGSWQEGSFGCCHDEVAKHFPELVPFIKWHLTSSDGPMHYVENTLYWLGLSGWCDGKHGSPQNIEHARNCAVWPEMPESLIRGNPEHVKEVLMTRLEDLRSEFKSAVESLGFVY